MVAAGGRPGSGQTDPRVVSIREVRPAAGAEILVTIYGGVMTMPGVPQVPAAEKIDLVDGRVVGLF